jgi:hypothetical protein
MSTMPPAPTTTPTEPVAWQGAVTGAITSTIAILAFAGVDGEVVGALSVAATAWVGVAAVVVRSRVSARRT